MWAVCADQANAANTLLSLCDVDRNARDTDGATALHQAAQLGRLEMTQLLLSNGWHVTVSM